MRCGSTPSDQVLDDLLLQGRLPDLTRAAQNDRRREPGMQLPEQDIERPAAVGRKDTSRFPLPPRVRPTEMSVELGRQADTIEDVPLGKSCAGSTAWLREEVVTSGRDRTQVYQTAPIRWATSSPSLTP